MLKGNCNHNCQWSPRLKRGVSGGGEERTETYPEKFYSIGAAAQRRTIYYSSSVPLPHASPLRLLDKNVVVSFSVGVARLVIWKDGSNNHENGERDEKELVLPFLPSSPHTYLLLSPLLYFRRSGIAATPSCLRFLWQLGIFFGNKQI